MSSKQEILMSELNIMLEKEREMMNLYNGILDELEHVRLIERVSVIRDDEIKHIGYVKILMSLLEGGPEKEEFSNNHAKRNAKKPTFR